MGTDGRGTFICSHESWFHAQSICFDDRTGVHESQLAIRVFLLISQNQGRMKRGGEGVRVIVGMKLSSNVFCDHRRDPPSDADIRRLAHP